MRTIGALQLSSLHVCQARVTSGSLLGITIACTPRLDRRGRRLAALAARTGDLNLAQLDVAGQAIEPAHLLVRLPGRPARVEHVVHLLEAVPLGLGRHEGHVDARGAVEGGEDEVHLPVDGPEQRRHGEGEHHVPEPVRRRGERDRLGAHLAGEDLGRVRPGRRAPGRGEGGDEEVRGRYDALGYIWVVLHDPGYVFAACAVVWLAVCSLETTFVKLVSVVVSRWCGDQSAVSGYINLPEMNKKTIMKNAPKIKAGRRPILSRYRIAGRVRRTLMTYWIDAVVSGEAIWAPSMI